MVCVYSCQILLLTSTLRPSYSFETSLKTFTLGHILLASFCVLQFGNYITLTQSIGGQPDFQSISCLQRPKMWPTYNHSKTWFAGARLILVGFQTQKLRFGPFGKRPDILTYSSNSQKGSTFLWTRIRQNEEGVFWMRIAWAKSGSA